MAIRRCPYCKAIIDEQDKYCNNCGTQLLFPEDEFVEEDIPGDKIIDKEEESEEAEEEVLEEEDEAEEEEADEEELEFVGEEKGKVEEPQVEKQEEELGERIPTGEVIEEEEAGKEDRELKAWMELKEEISKKAQREGQETGPQDSLEVTKEEPSPKIKEADKKYEVSIEEDELVFKTKELDKLTQTVEEGKREEKEEAPVSETKEDLPPWVSGMKEAPLTVTPDREEEVQEEQKPMRQEWATDSGIGIPEKVTQTTLPFTDTMAREEERGEEREEEMEKEAVEGAEARPPAGFSLKLKAKFVDLIFITALWLISLGFTARVIKVSFFKIIFGSPLPVFAFYLILLLLYFFLFLYFLGETLGDHYFAEED